jgi:TfoX/Sxy family transcriptional regulator of competence genes
MPYSEELDARIGEMISGWHTERKKMFGGTCRLLRGNMMCGVYKDFLILRLGKEQARRALKDPRFRPFDITGRPMEGWVMVPEESLSDRALGEWLEAARKFAAALPPK